MSVENEPRLAFSRLSAFFLITLIFISLVSFTRRDSYVIVIESRITSEDQCSISLHLLA